MNKLSPRQVKFAEKYLESGNATQAVIDAGYSAPNRKVAQVQGSKLLKNESVWALIENSAEQAQGNMVKLANGAKNESVRLGANKDILDRAGFAPVNKTQVTTINIAIDNQKFDDIMGMYNQRNQKKTPKGPENSAQAPSEI